MKKARFVIVNHRNPTDVTYGIFDTKTVKIAAFADRSYNLKSIKSYADSLEKVPSNVCNWTWQGKTEDFLIPPLGQKIYIAGPMRGIPQYNFAAFDVMAARLRASGYEPVNPADLDRGTGFDVARLPADFDWHTMPDSLNLDSVIRRDTSAIMECTGFVMLSGWEKSVGATAERALLIWKRAFELDANTLEEKTAVVEVQAPIAAQAPAASADDSNPKDLLGLLKTPLRLVPPALTIFVAQVMGLGAKKYGPYNWREKKVRHTVYLEAALRHILASLDGQDADPESGLPHEAHAAACMGIILDAKENECLINDKPKPGPAAKLLERFTVKK